MKRFFIVLIIVSMPLWAVLEAAESYYFYVQLSDKKNSPYSVNNPQEYLSARAIERRNAFQISCDSTDLPVNQQYVDQITALGVTVHNRSKWLNGVTVLTTDSSVMAQVRLLPCVRWARYTGKTGTISGVRSKSRESVNNFDYGLSATQINQINGTYLHNQGYTGKGIVVGVLDGGFYKADVNPGFDSLRLQGRLLGVKDMILSGNNVYAENYHGANVLSIMTGNKPGSHVGTAPHASFWLIRTEYDPSEYVVETDFWVSGIEFADSVGVDVVNSSLGYTTFDDPTMNYSYADMNGKVSRASIAAGLAAGKGIIVCNSAGNEGNKAWYYIGAPADADGILAIGAVTATGAASSFTSYGPAADGRVKPDVSAMGTLTSYVNPDGETTTGNGTSYSSPVVAGMMACLLQYIKANYQAASVSEILQSVRESASLYQTPNARLGYGIPDFQKAASIFSLSHLKRVDDNLLEACYNPVSKNIDIQLAAVLTATDCLVRLYSVSGAELMVTKLSAQKTSLPAQGLSAGVYILRLQTGQRSTARKLIIQ
jgi:hypothetical protein